MFHHLLFIDVTSMCGWSRRRFCLRSSRCLLFDSFFAGETSQNLHDMGQTRDGWAPGLSKFGPTYAKTLKLFLEI